jgi:hypothetical protein
MHRSRVGSVAVEVQERGPTKERLSLEISRKKMGDSHELTGKFLCAQLVGWPRPP